MQNILRILRYVVFGLVVTCNAIITSVAVWDQNIGAAYHSVFSVDTYIICLGALGLVFVFLVLFLELARRDSVTGTVWFECSWTLISFAMNLAGALALSAIVPRQLCLPNPNSATDVCNSTRTLLAFSWIVTLVLLMYLMYLVSSILLLQGEHPPAWSLLVRRLPSLSPKSVLSSEPPSPVLPRFASIQRPPAIVAPIPRPVITGPEGLYLYRSRFDLEQYQPHELPAVRPVDVLDFSAATREHQRCPLSFYPQIVHNVLQTMPEVPILKLPSQLGVPLTQHRSPPPPLGDWPRPDVLTQPVRSKRTKHSNIEVTTSSRNVGSACSSRPFGPREMSTLVPLADLQVSSLHV
ncbi:hypothetical protein AX15_003914 [Amanita polypyramis BW_CC]|nr:hypothetical protein AX15_003914 [Amanita polypyramis BW_CC]